MVDAATASAGIAGDEPQPGDVSEREALENAARAKEEAARRIRKRIFAALSGSVVVLSLIVVGDKYDWAFLGDLSDPSNVHWEAWRDILAVLVGGPALSWVASVSFTRLAINNVLTQLVDARVTQIINKYKTVYNAGPADDRVPGELSALRRQIATLEKLLEVQQANPAHVRQVEDFLKYATDERIGDLKQQLREDLALFEKVKEAMGRFTAEFEARGETLRRFAE